MKKDNKVQKNKAQENLEEQFQQLGKDVKAPDDLKQEVFSTLDTINLFADIADLFTGKFAMTELEALGISELTEEVLIPIDKKALNGSAKTDNDHLPTSKEANEK